MIYYWGIRDPGSKYEINEDAWKYFECKNISFMMVADGFGGKEGLNFASNIALNEIRSYIDRTVENDNPEHLKRVINDAAYLANRVLLGYKAADKKTYTGYGASLTLCALTNNNDIVIFHTGNTRLYIIRKDMITQFTRDFTEAQEQLEQGKSRREELRNHPGRKLLTGAFGIDTLRYEITTGKVQIDDVLILCTDGVYDLLMEQEMMSIVQETGGDLKTTCEWLKDGAVKRGGIDNIAAIVSLIK